jgi:hypothetical protein
MRIQQVFLFAAAAAVSLGALADPTIAPSPNRADVVQQTVQGNSGYRLTADEAEHMRGVFQLDDGRKLTVTSKRTRLYAELDGKTEELVPVSPTAFVARASGLRLAFDQVPFGGEVVIDKVAR